MRIPVLGSGLVAAARIEQNRLTKGVHSLCVMFSLLSSHPSTVGPRSCRTGMA
jgi:hypothetical protein